MSGTNELFAALRGLCDERGITPELLIERMQTSLALAVRKDFPGTEHVLFDVDLAKNVFDVFIGKEVVATEDDIEDVAIQISLDSARKVSGAYNVGDICRLKVDTKVFGRISAMAAKQMLRLGVRDAEHELMLERWGDLKDTLITTEICAVDPESGNVVCEVNGNKMTLYRNEQIPDERFELGDIVKVYVSAGGGGEKRVFFKLTRTSEDFLRAVFAFEVPEIEDGTIEIRAVSRIPGFRSKIAVFSNDENVEAVGSCIGQKRRRIQAVRDELNGEKIDVVSYDDDIVTFVRNALLPASVSSVDVEEREGKERLCTVIVPENQLSLAIGNRGQNAKLAARLTGCKIDIKPESDYYSA